MNLRPVTEDDLEAMHRVFAAAETELHTRRGCESPVAPAFDPDGRWVAIHRHLLAHDGERMFAATVGGRIAGYTSAYVRGDRWYLAALFIHPDHQGAGLGKALLDRVWGDHPHRGTLAEAIQPVSTGLYAGRGLTTVIPVLDCGGRPRAGWETGLEPSPPDPATLAELDLIAYGFDRAVDHELWARMSARATVWRRGGDAVAYSYGRPTGIGPVAGRDPESAVDALRAELARSAAAEDTVSVLIPGSCGGMLAVVLEAGLRLSDPGLLMLSPGIAPPAALALHSFWLM